MSPAIRKPRAISWIPKIVAVRVHEEQLRRHGGDAGVLNESRLDAALVRPRQAFAYAPEMTCAELAASLGVGIAKGHAFIDGNKRTAAVLSMLFLELNGQNVSATDDELADLFISVADGSTTERDLAKWFSEYAF